MRIVFLDIDGVLNGHRYLSRPNSNGARIHKHLNPKRIKLLKWVIGRSGAIIVLSSSWRELFHQMIPLEPSAMDLLAALNDYGLGITDMTPLCGTGRPEEIKQWLSEHPGVQSFVVLDDQDHNWGELSPQWVKTNSYRGITCRSARKAVRILCKE